LHAQRVAVAIQPLDHGTQVKARTQRLQALAHRRGRLRRQQAGHQLLGRRHHIHLVAAQAQVVGELTADQPGAHDQHPLAPLGGGTEMAVVEQVVDRMHGIGGIAGQRYPQRLRAPGDHQVAVDDRLVAQPDALRRRLQPGDLGMGANLGLQLRGHRTGAGHAQAFGILVHGKAGGEHRLGIRAAIVAGDQQQRNVAVQLAQFACEVVAGQAGADDDDGCSHEVSSLGW